MILLNFNTFPLWCVPGRWSQIAGSILVLFLWSAPLYSLGLQDFIVKIGNCTGFITGPDSLVTAAECVTNGVKGQFTYGGLTKNFTCKHHPNYRPTPAPPAYNVAACALEEEIALTEYAWISQKIPWRNDRVQMSFLSTSISTIELFIFLVGSQDLIFNSKELVIGSPIYTNIANKYEMVGVVTYDSDSAIRGYAQRFDLFNVQGFFIDFADSTGVQICGITALCTPGQTDQCKREREIVDFYQNELGLAKELLNQCIETGK